MEKTKKSQTEGKKMIEDFGINEDKFIDFCILCGCDYSPSIPRLGNVTIMKLIKQYDSIEEIMKHTKYNFPENYLEVFHAAKHNFLMYKDKLDRAKIFVKNEQDREAPEHEGNLPEQGLK